MGVNRRSTIVVLCLHCRHKGVMDEEVISDFGLKPNAPIASFVKRFRCSKCGSGSVLASASNQTWRLDRKGDGHNNW
jgi:RNase P subunit RPR2